MHVYAGFWKVETDSQNCLKLLEILTDPQELALVYASMTFIKAHCGHIHQLLTWTEAARTPLAPFVLDKLAALRESLVAGCYAERLQPEVELAISRLPPATARQFRADVRKAHKLAADKFDKHLERHPAREQWRKSQWFNIEFAKANVDQSSTMRF